MPGPRRNVFRTQSTPSPVPNCAKLRLDGSQSASAAIGSGSQSCASAGIASSYGLGGVSSVQAGLLSSCGEGSYLSTQGISHSDETERSIPMTTMIMQPRHAHIPDIGLDNNLLFELVAFVHSVMVLCLQYINLYKTVWWLPHSNANYALNFYLIDVNLCGILIIIMSRRLLYCFYKEVCYSKSSRGCLYWFVHLIKILIIAAILVAFFYCAYHIVLKHSFKYSLFLCYPLVTYFILFRLNMKPLFGKLTVHHQASNQQDKNGLPVVGTPRHRLHEQVVKELPTHVCTMSPEAIREEVEMLKTDFNGRVTQILFNSMLCAYYMGCVPLCFAQNTLYYDSWWVGQYVGLVWVGTFILFAVHYMPIKYLDVFHRCSVHLGHWVKVEGRSAHIPYTAWSELQVWPQEALVKHVKGLFKAEGYNNAAEPGNGSHSRFYFMFQQPLRVTNLVLGVAAALVSYQFLLLIQASQWNHILTLAFLLFSNYYVLFKLARDRCLLGKVYKDS